MRRGTNRVAIAAALLLAAACGGGSTGGTTDAVADANPDATTEFAEAADPAASDPAADASEATAELAEATPDGADATSDAPDGLPDADAATDAPPEACTPPGPVPQDTPDPALKKFALSMFHFNMQYVAGGLITTWNGKTVTMCDDLGVDPSYCDGWDDDHQNDWDIDVGFAPVLDLFLKHPTWKTTFEIPGIMMERIASHHPDVLAKLQGAAASGQIEIVSFHWSAQLFMAFPALDLERSLAMARDVFARYCIPLSKVVFNQEGQDGEGKHAFMAAHDLSIDLMHENQFGYVQWQVPIWPWYRSHGVDVVVGPPSIDGNAGLDPASGIDVKWTFFDDGEILPVPADPYLSVVNPAPDASSMAAFELKTSALEAQGYKVTHLTDYVAHLRAQGLSQPDLPPFIEGTWQPIDTDGIHQWMGRRGRLGWSGHERDNIVRTGNFRASRDLAAAEVLADTAARSGVDVAAARDTIAQAWRQLLMAEVSDATGINPFQGEWNYGNDHNAATEALVDGIFPSLLGALGWPHATVDLAAGTAARLDGLPAVPTLPRADPPLAVTVDAPTRTTAMDWRSAGDGHWLLRVSLGPGGDPTGDDVTKRIVTVTFPRTADEVSLTPALMEDQVVTTPMSDFHVRPDAQYPSGTADVYVPAVNGLIGLGDGWWVVRDDRTVMIAPRLPLKTAVVQFIDETADPAGPPDWIFHVVQGTAQQALDVATRLNIKPVILR